MVVAAGLMALTMAACGASIQASGGSNGGQFPVGTAGSYQYTITTPTSVSYSWYVELENNDVNCTDCKPVGPWEVQLPIAANATTATGTIYLIAGNYTGVPGIGVSWSLTLSLSS
jgi:hypothetical protein